MDWECGKLDLITYIKKYRYLVLILLSGIFLMSMPKAKETETAQIQVTETATPDLQTMLADILGQISGVGKAQVLLTCEAGPETVYQMDEDLDQGDSRQDTVILTNADRAEAGLVKQINPPVYKGAVVVCQGADSASVRLSVMNAVKSVTGLSSDSITVLKMK